MLIKKVAETLASLEEKYHLLSDDQVDQEVLFEIQDILSELLYECANQVPGMSVTLIKKFPYLFEQQK